MAPRRSNRRRNNRRGGNPQYNFPAPGRMPQRGNRQRAVVARDRLNSHGDLTLEIGKFTKGLSIPIAPFALSFGWDLKYKYVRVVSIEVALFTQRPATEGVKLFAWMGDPSTRDVKGGSDPNNVIAAWLTAVRKSQCSDSCLRTTFRPPTSRWLPNTPVSPDKIPVTDAMSSCDLGIAATGSAASTTTQTIKIASYNISLIVEYKDSQHFGDKLDSSLPSLESLVSGEPDNEDLATADTNHPQFVCSPSFASQFVDDTRIENLVLKTRMNDAIYKSYGNNGGWEYETLDNSVLVIPGFTESVKTDVVVEKNTIYAPAWNYNYPDRRCECCHIVRALQNIVIKRFAYDTFSYLYYPNVLSTGLDTGGAIAFVPAYHLDLFRVRDGKVKQLVHYEHVYKADPVAHKLSDGYLAEGDLLVQHIRYFDKYEGEQAKIADYWWSCLSYNMVHMALVGMISYDSF